MNLNALQYLLTRQNQRFICIPAGDSCGSRQFVAQIRHEVTPSLSQAEIGELGRILDKNSQLLEFYSQYGSLRLYCDALSESSGFYIAPPNEWEGLHSEFSLWLLDLDEETVDSLPDWLESALVFGELPSSGNYLFYVLSGANMGSIFEFEHDGFEFVKIANNYSQFLDVISIVTDDLLDRLASYVRYSDGTSNTQWIPAQYLSDS